MMEPNLLVSYASNAGYMSGKSEIHNILTKLGDQKSEQELLVPGIIGVKTKLAAREVVEEVSEMLATDPDSVKFTIKWVPADFWCAASIDAVKQIVKEDIKDSFSSNDVYNLEIINHRSSLNADDLMNAVKPLLKGRLDADFPQKILRIELFDKRASITLLKPKDILSRE